MFPGRFQTMWNVEGDQCIAFASDLMGSPGEPACPKCGGAIKRSALEVSRDGEGEVVAWKGAHACGARLTIFND